VTLSVAVHTIDLTVTDDDTDTGTDSVVITVNPYVNMPPTADAGPDQNVTDTDENGSEDVTLDGSASDDPDGTIVSYVWEENSSQIATGVSPVVTLDVNVHTIDLTVTDDDTAADTDSLVVTVEAPVTSEATLTVVETAGDYFTVTAHDSVTPAIEYWEIMVDIQSGCVFSFKDLTDAGDGQGGHNSYLDTDAYGRQCGLIFFDGRGGNLFTRSNPLDDLATHLTFTTAGDNSSFTITYAEDGSTTDWFHDSYSSGDQTLYPGDLERTIEIVIRPPTSLGTVWDWTITSQNVSAHDLTLKVWAEEYVSGYLYDGIVKTSDNDQTLVDGPWNESSPVSFFPWTIGSNPSLGFTAGREIAIDRQSALAAYTDGGTIAYTTWAGFAYNRYKSAFSYSGVLGVGGSRATTGQVLINITDGGEPPSNIPPTADAGPDQNVADTDENGSEDVTLDGSGSSDSDGTIVSYEWEENSSQIATGVSPVVTLDVSVHTIDLIVTDDDSDTGTDSVVITVSAPSAGEVLFVAGSGTLGAADQAVADLLTAMDYTVTSIDDDVATAADATGKVLVVISATVNANLVLAEFRTVAIPVLTWEKEIMDDMDLTTSQGVERKQTQVDIVDPGHAMAAGLSGAVAVYTGNEYITWGAVTAGADVAASVVGDSSQAAVFGYETSDVMANGYGAPARRAGVFLDADSAEVLTTDGASLIHAALSWALGL